MESITGKSPAAYSAYIVTPAEKPPDTGKDPDRRGDGRWEVPQPVNDNPSIGDAFNKTSRTEGAPPPPIGAGLTHTTYPTILFAAMMEQNSQTLQPQDRDIDPEKLEP